MEYLDSYRVYFYGYEGEEITEIEEVNDEQRYNRSY